MLKSTPAHKIIQITRKTAIPKLSYDLSNKQNSNSSHLDVGKLRNTSSKKNSLQKSLNTKKKLTLTQNVFKLSDKNVSKILNESKQITTENKKVKQKKQLKSKETKSVVESLNCLLKQCQQVQNPFELQKKYDEIFQQLQPKHESQKVLFNSFSRHIKFWIQQFMELYKTFHHQEIIIKRSQNDEDPSLKLQNDYHQSSCSDSGTSVCSYLIDPKSQSKTQSIKKQLKEKLQLNFVKVDILRKKGL